ncbi:MAG: DUF1643 domain-containing protein [Myxococcota bacterium]
MPAAAITVAQALSAPRAQVSIKVLPNPHNDGRGRYRAFASYPGLGLIDSGGATPEEAEAKVRARWRRVWLGVDWHGPTLPECASNPESGEIAMNGNSFALWRRVGEGERLVSWIMLNPSVADARSDDATLRRCRAYAVRWGFGWLTVGNLWPRRTPDPGELFRWVVDGRDPSERQRTLETNDRYVLRMAQRAELTVCAWGSGRGRLGGRASAMRFQLSAVGVKPHALAVTRDGQPCHPLRLSRELSPRPLAELLAMGGARG